MKHNNLKGLEQLRRKVAAVRCRAKDWRQRINIVFLPGGAGGFAVNVRVVR